MTTPLPVYEDHFRVRHCEAGQTGFLKLESFFDYFQEVAGGHATLLGCGFQVLGDLNQMWILSRVKVAFLRTPCLGEKLLFRTWPSGAQRLFALREGLLLDEAGNDVAHATSYWVLLDSKRLRPLRVPESIPCAMPDNSGLPHYFDITERIPHDGLEAPMSFTVHDHLLDINHHLNNARYFSMVSDWLAKRISAPPRIAVISASFLLATPPGTDIEVRGTLAEDGSFRTGIFSTDGIARFIAQGELQK